tara:strand:- start:535 stop:663 length:129 start_codon:yes stop_codon:yes gene_type:complete
MEREYSQHKTRIGAIQQCETFLRRWSVRESLFHDWKSSSLGK